MDPFLTSNHDILAIKEEIATNSLRIKVTEIDQNLVKLTLRKYNQEFINACKDVAGKYDGQGGWSVAVTSIPKILLTLAKDPQFDLAALESFLPSEATLMEEISHVSAIPTKTPTGFPLFPHQIEDVAFLLKPAKEAKGHSKLLGNDMGLGKSLVSIVTANIMFPEGRFLVVVPAVAKLNWAKEIKKWIGSDEKVQVVNGRSSALESDARWTIINYDIISSYQEVLMNSTFDIAILDEFHNCKSIVANRTKALIPTYNATTKTMDRAILSNIPTVWTLTGTFIMNRMKELFTTLRAVDHKLGKSKRKYEERYCEGQSRSVYGRTIWEANGAANLPELAAKIAPIYRRVLKTDVLEMSAR